MQAHGRLIAVVRHAAAGVPGFGPEDRLRPLIPKGIAQAQGLVAILAEVPLARVLSSPYLRCRQTVEPLAAARGVEVEEFDWLGAGAGVPEVIQQLIELAPDGAALCSHGDVIGGLVQLLVHDGLVQRAEAQFAKGSTWLMDVREGRIATARYLAPPVTQH